MASIIFVDIEHQQEVTGININGQFVRTKFWSWLAPHYQNAFSRDRCSVQDAFNIRTMGIQDDGQLMANAFSINHKSAETGFFTHCIYPRNCIAGLQKPRTIQAS
ncbi:MAG: hypothetical protein CME86_02580 [Herbaspirillum sp.]|nr:hypothetical protein [Herbaspirillum sp.]